MHSTGKVLQFKVAKAFQHLDPKLWRANDITDEWLEAYEGGRSCVGEAAPRVPVRALIIPCNAHARGTLEKLLGPPTATVETGGLFDQKLFLHYRLKTPVVSKDDLKNLELARELAAGIDGVFDELPPAHHDPKVCRIVNPNPGIEIDLTATLEILRRRCGNGSDPSAANRAASEPTSDIDTRTVMVTFFPNKSAQSQRCIELTLPQLAEQIRLETGPSKLELPWLKLMVFGDTRSAKGCLRTNANAKEIIGIEVEHDKGEITFDTAIAVMRKCGVRALLYTSPSYIPATKERWRILLPLSEGGKVEGRSSLVARVNGLFGGALANESFNLSQAYLYGSVNNNPAHRVEVIDGDFIDLCDDLDLGAMGKSPGNGARERGTPGEGVADRTIPGRTEAEIVALLELSQTEGEWHIAMLSATASMVGRGWTNDRIYKLCAPYCWEGEGDPDVEEMVEGARAKWNIPDGATPERLARLAPFEYELQRKSTAKELGVRVAQLDSMVDTCRQRDQADDIEEEIAEINTEYALVLAGNKAAVMKFDDPTKFRLLQPSAFQTWFANHLIGSGRNVVSLGDYWLSHKERRQYAGIEFAPPGSALHPGFYNLWQGFAVVPCEGDCSKFLAHVKDNVARGDEATFLWIIGWWAAIFQLPSIKMETALVLRGPFGAGKTKVGEVFGSLIGERHYLSVAASRHITGQFNSHMASLLVLHADEAFWAGDKSAVGTLRDLVSGKDHPLEYKGVDKIWIKNHIRLFISGNPDWMVPAGFRERRWAVFDVGEDKMQDNAYFAAIDEEMANGGREALLHYLLNFDLRCVNLRVVPKTAALLDQQIESMTPEQAWWFETLLRGELPSPPHGVNEPRVCLRDSLFERYIRHAKVQGITRKSIETKIGIFLRKQLGGELRLPQPYVDGKQLDCYGLPPLAECRKRFNEKLGQTVDWGDGWENRDWQHGSDWSLSLAMI